MSKFAVKLRAPYNYDVDAASDEAGLRCDDVSLAKQEFKEESDINTIVRRFGLTGQLPTDVRMPQSADVTDIGSFQEAMNAVVAARESFDLMPAEVRARFGNDAMAFADFCVNPDNFDEAAKLGLIKPESIEARRAAAVAARKAEIDAEVRRRQESVKATDELKAS